MTLKKGAASVKPVIPSVSTSAYSGSRAKESFASSPDQIMKPVILASASPGQARLPAQGRLLIVLNYHHE